MKTRILLCLLAFALSACSDKSAHSIRGVYFKCSGDLDQEKRFLQLEGNDVLDGDAKKEANAKCNSLTGGTATNVELVYKNGATKAAD